MKVLFLSGGNSTRFCIPPLIRAQGESLKRQGVSIDYFPIIGRGIKGYLSNVLKLKKYIHDNPVDIIHAHYSFSGVVASLACFDTPVIVSLLGSDVNGPGFLKDIILKSSRFLPWKAIIVKTAEMSEKLGKTISYIIPNGVDTNLFKPLNSIECKSKLNLDALKTHILFAANPNRPEKNFSLTSKAIKSLGNSGIELHYLENVEHQDVPVWYNAADLVVLSSLWEGSPNVIKEAIACNRPIVATDVGDIRWLFGNEQGYFISDFTFEDFREKIMIALEFSKGNSCTIGRERLFELGLDSERIAIRIINIYESILNK